MWKIYTMEYYSAIKKEWNNASICSNMDEPGGYHTQWSKSHRETGIMWYHLYAESTKNDRNELIYKTKAASQA